MPSKPFPIVTDGIVGDVPTNFYPAEDSERKMILHGTPGLLLHCQLTNCTEVRGLYPWGSYFYAVARRGSESVLWRVDSSGGVSEIGTITTSTSGPVWITNNLTQLLIVDNGTGGSAYVYTPTAGSFVPITDANFFTASACDYQDSYGLFVQPNSIYWFLSALQNFTSFDGSRYSKEGTTDNILGILSNQLEVYLGGSLGTEIWQNTGGDNLSAATMTFQRTPGGLLKYGWASAKAGCICDNRVSWVTDKGQVVIVSGYSPQIISTDMFGRDIKSMSTFSDVFTFSYVDQEHTFLCITFPTADLTVVWDAKTKLWHKRSSYLDDGSGYGRHRANCYALFNHTHYVGDYSNGKIYKMSTDYYDDDGNVFPGILYTKEVDGGQTDIQFPAVKLLAEMGQGQPSGVAPQASLEKSNDGGHTYSTPRWQSMGLVGEYKRNAIWLRQGMDKRRLYRLTITDPIRRTILGVDVGN